VGLVAFYLAAKYQTVYAVDVDAHNLELAQRNAERNNIRNVQFKLGKAEELLTDKRFWLQEAKPEVVVVDPPRSGLHPKVITSLLAARPKQLVYVSCNAQSLARDLQLLLTGFPRYRICSATGFDLFPHTNHLEVLTLLERV
jgi:23S rRNA (uracil1939-C5)-methyltransferase